LLILGHGEYIPATISVWINFAGNMAEEAGVEPTKPVINRLHRV